MSSRHSLRELMETVQNGDIGNDTALLLLEELNKFIAQLRTAGGAGAIQKIEWLWKRVLELYKDRPNAMLMYNYALFLVDRRKFLEAYEHLLICLSINHNFDVAKESMENVSGLIADRWHIRMLNDRLRNESYDAAIRHAIGLSPNCVVLDIGGGTGLLSMFAVRAGARMVYCCEASAAMCSLATRIIDINGMTDKIKIINKHSNELLLGDDIPHKVDLIVTELVDSGLLGEHIVTVLGDARKSFLKEGGTVIPHSASVFGTIISSEDIQNRAYFSDIIFNINASVDENYTCENLKTLHHKKLTNEIEVCSIIFQELYDKKSFQFNRSTTCIDTGSPHAFAYWFRLNLLPDRDDISFETHPCRSDCGWDQSLVFLQKNDKNSSIILQTNQIVDVLFSITVDKIHVGISGMQESPNLEGVLFLCEMDLAAMNDCEWFNSYVNSAEAILLQHSNISSNLRVIEMSSKWKSVALNLAQKSNIALSRSSTRDFLLYGDCIEQVDYLNSIAEKNSISDFNAYLSFPLNDVHRHHNNSSKLLICDIVDSSGLIRQNILRELQCLFKFNRKDNIFIIPHKMDIILVLVESESKCENFVCPENTCNIDVSLLNRYSSRRVCELDLSASRFLSAVVKGVTFPIDLLFSSENEDIVCGRTLITAASDGRLDMIGFWYEIHSAPQSDNFFSTGPRLRDRKSHWRQAAHVLDVPVDLRMGQSIEIEVSIEVSFGVECRIVNLRRAELSYCPLRS